MIIFCKKITCFVRDFFIYKVIKHKSQFGSAAILWKVFACLYMENYFQNVWLVMTKDGQVAGSIPASPAPRLLHPGKGAGKSSWVVKIVDFL